MIEVFKKIWEFAGSEQKEIKKSIIIGFFYAIFHCLQIGAIFITVRALVNEDINIRNSWYALGIMMLSIIGKIITNYFSQLQRTHAGYFMVANKRIFIGNKMKSVPMGFFNSNSLGNIIGITTTVLDDVENTAPMVLVQTLGGFINTVIFTVYILVFDWRIGLIVAGGIFLFCLVTNKMEKKSRNTAPLRQKAEAALVENVLETIHGMSVVKSFNLTHKDNKKIDKAIENSKDTNLAMEKLLTPYTIAQQSVLRIFSVLIMFASLYFYFQGTMELTFALMFLVVSFIIFEQIEAVGHGMAILRVAGSSIEHSNQLNDIPIMDEKGKVIIPKKHDIRLNHVSFSYGQRKILDDVSVTMKDKTMTAIVGPSGSGKTTICNLIARFWDVDHGNIEIGGHDIREYTLESLMNQISIVFQNVYLFQDTVENNIKFGMPNATHEEVVEAAKKACCHEFISSLQEGYQTVIGENGASLSGGEKQRISIARAMLKDAPIVIFDEATANVDPENEDRLQSAIEALTKNKTIIMIAHRLKTIRKANQIIVVDNGRIVQHGTHQILMNQRGIYSDFIQSRKQAIGWKLVTDK